MREFFHEGLCEISHKKNALFQGILHHLDIFACILTLPGRPLSPFWMVSTNHCMYKKGGRALPSQVKKQAEMSQWCTLHWKRAFLMRNFTQSLMKKLPHATAQDCVTTCPSSLLYLHPHKSKLLPVVMMLPFHLFEFNLVLICYEEYVGMLEPSNIKVIIFFINMLSGKIYV